ncbi:hypothetical protein [Sphingomonas sp. Leaf412]|uniref:hypothetical protein n=1 Tax=Sphingomonas sp. Leaf412 TaxID=1736370 RepID=UPI000AD67ADB|nr:hypothetical protein [Sphingomonas sp. Leaf412]
MSDHSRPRRSVRTMGGWPALAVLFAVIAAVLYFTLIRHDPAAEVRVGSGTAQAMWDGTHPKEATPARQ